MSFCVANYKYGVIPCCLCGKFRVVDREIKQGEKVSCGQICFTTSKGVKKSYDCNMAVEATNIAFDFFLKRSEIKPIYETWSQCYKCHIWCWRQDLDNSKDEKTNTFSQDHFSCGVLGRPCFMPQISTNEMIDELLDINNDEIILLELTGFMPDLSAQISDHIRLTLADYYTKIG
jgi:hypothetical protein